MGVLFSGQINLTPSNRFVGVEVAAPAYPFFQLEIALSRENWPVAGIDIGLEISFDNGLNYIELPATHIGPWIDDGKNPLSDAVLGWGWATQPTHFKGYATATNPTSTFVIIRVL